MPGAGGNLKKPALASTPTPLGGPTQKTRPEATPRPPDAPISDILTTSLGYARVGPTRYAIERYTTTNRGNRKYHENYPHPKGRWPTAQSRLPSPAASSHAHQRRAPPMKIKIENSPAQPAHPKTVHHAPIGSRLPTISGPQQASTNITRHPHPQPSTWALIPPPGPTRQG